MVDTGQVHAEQIGQTGLCFSSGEFSSLQTFTVLIFHKYAFFRSSHFINVLIFIVYLRHFDI